MSNCLGNNATELVVPKTRSASQIQTQLAVPKKRHLRGGVGGSTAPAPSKVVLATRALGIEPCNNFPDFECVKQVTACFKIEPGTNDEHCCQKCPSPPPQPECGFPLPSPSPCCQPKPCCCPPPPPPPQPCCKPICGRVNKLQFNDPCPCDTPNCTWCIFPDECGRKTLVFQCCECDKAVLDCDGNLRLLGTIEATQMCLAPITTTPQLQWCLRTNTSTGALQLDNIDRENPLASNQLSPQTVSVTKAGAVVESAADVLFTPIDTVFTFNSNDLPATIIAHNVALLPNMQVKINAGIYNGQKVTIVNVNAAVMQVDLSGTVKNIAGETLITASWSCVALKWTASI